MTDTTPFGIVLTQDDLVSLVGVSSLREPICAECGQFMRWTLYPLGFTNGRHRNPFSLAHADCIFSSERLQIWTDFAKRSEELMRKED